MTSFISQIRAKHTERDRDRGLERLRAYAKLLDTSISIPGTEWKMGVDSLIGFVPVVGDNIGLVLSSWVLIVAVWHGVSLWTFLRMLANILIEATLGMIPIAGDIFDIWYRASTRNVRLLEREWLRD